MRLSPVIVEYAEGECDPVTLGEIIWAGEAPHTRVTVFQWHDGRRRLICADTLSEATITETPDGAEIVGLSAALKGAGPVKLIVTRTRKACCGQ